MMKNPGEVQKISGKFVDIHKREIYPATISFSNGKIKNVERTPASTGYFILPGLIDAHIHVESSMVTPGAFSVAAAKHGTVAVVSDPHEIANVLGIDGVKFMLDDAGKVPLKFYFGAPSCVPATTFETGGGSIGPAEIEYLLSMPDIHYLSEMMNFPGVISKDPGVLEKIKIAKRLNKPVDGHAPGLRGELLRDYIEAGISTDHECSTIDEAREKLSLGMKILIREGSAARNLDALKDLIKTNPDSVMLCSDDLHPEMLQKGHINKIISKLISEGFDVFDVIRSATVNTAQHYKMNAGMLQPGDPADFIIVGDVAGMNVLSTWIDGNKVYDNGTVLFSYGSGAGVNNFNCSPVGVNDIMISRSEKKIRVIQAEEGELLTGELLWFPAKSGTVKPEIGKDILKIVVKDRYKDAEPAAGFIRGFGLKKGAFAGSIAHDSHNIIAIGTNDRDIVDAINEIVRLKGGLAVAFDGKISSLQLDIAGIMTTASCDEVAGRYLELTRLVRSLGCGMKAPFMTLSFMALLVIPDLKISDRGLFDVRKFKLVPLFVD